MTKIGGKFILEKKRDFYKIVSCREDKDIIKDIRNGTSILKGSEE
jgi:hypothetical protein